MFPKGTVVYHLGTRRSGRVVETDGDTVYIEQDNGAELDFPAADLTTRRPDSMRPAEAGPATAGPVAPGPARQDLPPRSLTAADMTPEHAQVLASIPARTLQAIAALYDRPPRVGRFSALDLARKLNFIAEVTAVPYRTMRQHRGNPGELGLLMGKGLADSQRKAG